MTHFRAFSSSLVWFIVSFAKANAAIKSNDNLNHLMAKSLLKHDAKRPQLSVVEYCFTSRLLGKLGDLYLHLDKRKLHFGINEFD